MSTQSNTEEIGMKEVKSLLPIPLTGSCLYAMSNSGLFPKVKTKPVGRIETKWDRLLVLSYIEMVKLGASHNELINFVNESNS